MPANTSIAERTRSRAAFAAEKLAWAKEWFMAELRKGRTPTANETNQHVVRAFGQGLYSQAVLNSIRKWKEEFATQSTRETLRALTEPVGIPPQNLTVDAAVETILAAMKIAGIEKLLVTPDGNGAFLVDAEVKAIVLSNVKRTFNAP